MTRKLVELSSHKAMASLNEDSVIVLPVGSIEHHGPHLPLNTDYLMADLVGNAAVDRAAAEGHDVWVLPSLAYTKSDEHAWAPGTVWIGWETMMRTVVEIAESIAKTPATRLVFFNGHGGNVALLQVALREIRRRFGLRTFLMGVPLPAGPATDPAGPERGLGIHGGVAETSLVLHLRPELVDMSLAERQVPEHLVEYEYIAFHSKPVSFGWLSSDFGTGGVVGDPTGASAELGARIYEAALTRTVAAFAEIAAFTPEKGADG